MEKPYYNIILDRFFEIFGLSPTSSFEELRTRYHELAFKYHPDLNQDTEDKMKEINEAYTILKSNTNRINYVKKYGVDTTNPYLDGKTYKQEELERIKELLEQAKRKYQNKKNKIVQTYTQFDEDKFIESLKNKISKGIKVSLEFSKKLISNLKKQPNETISKYTVRNRKTLAGILVAAMVFNPFTVSGEKEVVEQPHQYENYQPSNLIEEQLIMRLHKVEENETLDSISSRYNVPVETLIQVNNIKYGKIRPHDLLKIPYYINEEDLSKCTVTVNSSDYKSLNDIAKLYNTDLRTIYSLNIECFELIDGKYYQISDNILVPDFTNINNISHQKAYSKS